MKFNFENELKTWTAFYEKHEISLPSDFSKVMCDIWERNFDGIETAVKEKDFDKILLIPGTVDAIGNRTLTKIMSEGYREMMDYDEFWRVDPGEIVNIRKGNRIVLVHSATDLTAHPELKKTLGWELGGKKDDKVNNTGDDFFKQGEKFTLPEWLILQRQIWETTGVHIDAVVAEKSPWIWLPGSSANSNMIETCWLLGIPGKTSSRFSISAFTWTSPRKGCRLSRSFS